MPFDLPPFCREAERGEDAAILKAQHFAGAAVERFNGSVRVLLRVSEPGEADAAAHRRAEIGKRGIEPDVVGRRTAAAELQHRFHSRIHPWRAAGEEQTRRRRPELRAASATHDRDQAKDVEKQR
jgi:hypothetical protein